MSDIRLPPKWIELNITKTECAIFLPVPNDDSFCQCGKKKMDHSDSAIDQHKPAAATWSPRAHTRNFSTDAYGTVIFEGEHHPNKAHVIYVRLSYDTNPELVLQLMTYVWNLDMPQLLISVRGGSSNFDMSPRLGKIFQTGLIKAARNTNAWIFSNGLNSGVAKHLGNALNNEKYIGGQRRGRLTAVGIASWGTVDQREGLVGRNKERPYTLLETNSKYFHLNPRHSNFLLVDNGSIGKFGVESYLRRRLEKCISSYPISPNRGCQIPAVVIVLEGGFYTLRQVSDYLYDEPPVPVVIFAGTGLSADLITFVVRKIPSEEDFINDLKERICHKIMLSFHVNSQQCAVLYKELLNIYRKRSLITIYNPNATGEEEFDAAILSSIFRSQHWTPSQQLSLTLVWNRVDIAQAEVFIYGREWSRDSLENAMNEALVSDRLDFVNLLLEHGINMQTFLTASRLEVLYSLETIPSKVLRTMLIEFSKIHTTKLKPRDKKGVERPQTDLTLHDIGIALSHMIGHVYQSSYIHIVAKIHKNQGGAADEQEIRSQTFLQVHFEQSHITPSTTQTIQQLNKYLIYFALNFTNPQPFDDLFVWAVLTKRHDMSKLLWKHGILKDIKSNFPYCIFLKRRDCVDLKMSLGKGGLAKALIAIKLNKYMAAEITAAEKSFTSNMAMDFENYAEEWENISVALLDACYRTNPKLSRQLLTMELESWSKQTCLTLAVLADHHMLLGHPCCQILLQDLWMGALNSKSNSTLKIILGIFFPPYAAFLEYKSTEELQQLPHQEKDHQPKTHDLYAEIPVPQDPESCVKSGQNQQSGGGDERTTDLAVVARSVYPLPNDNPDIVVNESGPEGQNPLKVSDRGTEISRERLSKRKECTESVARGKFDQSNFVAMQQTMGIWTKFVQFQSAPITNYMRHTIGYLIFLVAFIYVIMYKQNPDNPGWIEWYVIIYFITQFLECIREFMYIDALNFSEKVIEIQHAIWQFGDFVIVTACLGGVGLRLFGMFEYGMLILRVSSLYWNVRLYKYLGVHRFLGPKISMMRRMLKPMIHFSLIIVVFIMAFGIVRKAIVFPDSDPTLREIAESFLEPYLMMFGEVSDLDSLSAHCKKGITTGNELTNWNECPPGYWIVPIVWVVYMFVSNILIINVLIAVFDGIYEEIDALAVEVWMFQRFKFVMEFEQKPILPPPLIIISHAISAVRCLYQNFLSCLCEEELLLESHMDDEVHPHIIMGNDHGLKSFLSPEELTMVFDFEEECLDELTPLLEKDSPAGGAIAGSQATLGGHAGGSEPTVAGRHGGGCDKGAIQQMKLVISELHAELESQKSKLDKLINNWELGLANANGPDTSKGGNQSSSQGNNYLKEIENAIVLAQPNEGKISVTESMNEYS